LKVLEDLGKMADNRFVSSYDLALAHLGLGNKAKAFELIHGAIQERSPRVAFLGVDPRFDGLRDHPRFGELRPVNCEYHETVTGEALWLQGCVLASRDGGRIKPAKRESPQQA
jgi:hypothetical protein